MAASERLYELWLRYYTQVRPPAPPRDRRPQIRAPRTCYTCARAPGTRAA